MLSCEKGKERHKIVGCTPVIMVYKYCTCVCMHVQSRIARNIIHHLLRCKAAKNIQHAIHATINADKTHIETVVS